MRRPLPALLLIGACGLAPQDDFTLSARNIAGLSVVASNRVTARDVMDTTRVIATREAIEKLQESLG